MMQVRRQCPVRLKSGEPCRAPPVSDSQFCIMHSPEHAKEIQEARKLGGLRRKREVTVAGAYDFEGLGTVEGIRRLIEVAVLDTLGMENSLARARTLAYLAQVALRTLEVGDLEQRIGVLEQAVNGRRVEPANASVFEVDPAMLETGGDETKESSSENIGKEKTDATE